MNLKQHELLIMNVDSQMVEILAINASLISNDFMKVKILYISKQIITIKK